MKCKYHLCNNEVPQRRQRSQSCSHICANKYAVKKRRYKLKTMSIEYKGGKCERCGYSKCRDALQFHHLDPKKKDFHPSNKGHTRSWDRVRVELDKCIMVCANCHTEIHHEQNPQPFAD